MDRREFLALGSCALASGCLTRRPSPVGLADGDADAFRSAVDFLARTAPADYDRRQEALATCQKAIYAMKGLANNVYDEYVDGGVGMPSDEVARYRALCPVFEWYDDAFDRVLREVRETAVTDAPAVWYVYNMGVIVKTRESCFAIDLCHRKAAEAVPLLDFALVTHNHGDHWTREFVKAMGAADKPVISSFLLVRGWYTREETAERKIGDVTVRITTADHNDLLIKAVSCFEVSVGRGEGKAPYVIFHSGDSCRAGQFRSVTKHPDLFIGHCAVGLSFPEAYKTTMPAKRMVIAHHQELGHLWGLWRCVGFHEEPAQIMAELRALGADVVMPVWGDRLDT